MEAERGKLQLDFGKFSTWIGAEVADSQGNMTYTRSVLFYTQPVFHTGLRLDYAASDQVDLKLYAVNGWNNSVDNNAMKTFGATVTLMPTKDIAFYVGYIGGPESNEITTDAMGNAAKDPDANSKWKHLVDFIADLHFDKARVLINADYGTEKVVKDPEHGHSWYGVSGTFGYAISDSGQSRFAAATPAIPTATFSAKAERRRRSSTRRSPWPPRPRRTSSSSSSRASTARRSMARTMGSS